MRRMLRETIIVGLGALGALYLIYPSLGVFELIPDAVPLIGSLDEAGATILVINTLAYYGLDLNRLYDRSPRNLPPPQS